jgi:hypothetical protein
MTRRRGALAGVGVRGRRWCLSGGLPVAGQRRCADGHRRREGVLAVVSGLVDRFNRWVRGHRIAPAVLVAVTAFLTWFAKQGWDELESEKSRMKTHDPDPPDLVGSS